MQISGRLRKLEQIAKIASAKPTLVIGIPRTMPEEMQARWFRDELSEADIDAFIASERKAKGYDSPEDDENVLIVRREIVRLKTKE